MSGEDGHFCRRLVLPDPVLLELRGPDAVRYLNGQVTQDVRLATDAKSVTACVTDAKGKLQFRVWIHTHEGALRISCDHEGKEDLMARLDRYLISDDAELVDISGEWRRLHLIGTEPASENGQVVSSGRIRGSGWDVWLPADQSSKLDAIPAADPDEAETRRIVNGIPAWGSELTPGMLPPEAGLERTDISYSKGCYIGQEVISRMKTAGKVNRRLTKFVFPAEIAVATGDAITDGEGKEAGVLTSVAPLSDGGQRALLGYVKRSAEGSGLVVNGVPVAVIR